MGEPDVDAVAVVVQLDDLVAEDVTETTAARAASLSAWLPAIQEIDEVCGSLSDTQRAFAIDLLERLTAAMERSGRV